jgi:hypothetical protein
MSNKVHSIPNGGSANYIGVIVAGIKQSRTTLPAALRYQ